MGNTKGSWHQMIASTAMDAKAMSIGFMPSGGAQTLSGSLEALLKGHIRRILLHQQL